MTDRTPQKREPDAGHPISVVAARTGLSRDVLRMWERRYRAVEPGRSDGGQRRYSDEDVHRFKLLATATQLGRSIGLVAPLATEDLARLVAADEAALPAPTVGAASAVSLVVDSAMACIRALDATALDTHLRRAIARDGTSRFLEETTPALMHAVGDEWAGGTLTIAHEHLASAVVHAIILGIVRGLPSSASAPRVLIATPSGERHAVGAALAAAAAAIEGWRVVYLGADVPAADIVAAAHATHVHAIALSVVYVTDKSHLLAELDAVRASMDTSMPVFVGGAGVAEIANDLSARGIMVCAHVADLRVALDRASKSGMRA